MKKKLKSRIVAGVLSLATVFSCMPSMSVLADSQKIITLGSDLSQEQRDTVLAFFGVSENNLEGIEVLEISNADEHELLDGIIPDAVIGKKTYSCAYIEPTMSGGIYIRTANLTYVTNTSLYNALQTAGIENCNLLVTAPFKVSGTGALTGVFKAFESTGKELDEGKKEAAAEELILDAKLESTYGEETSSMVSDIKEEVVSSKEDLSEEELKDVVETTAEEYEVSLSEEDTQKLVDLMDKIQGMEYEMDAFSTKMEDIMGSLEGKAEEAKGLLGSISGFFKSVGNFFKGLFGGNNEESSTPSIFDNVDTSIFEFDDTKEGNSNNESEVQVEEESLETQEESGDSEVTEYPEVEESVESEEPTPTLT